MLENVAVTYICPKCRAEKKESIAIDADRKAFEPSHYWCLVCLVLMEVKAGE